MGTSNQKRTFIRALPWLIGPTVCGVMIGTFFAAPEFFHRYVLSAQMREYQAVELTTFGASSLAGLILLWAAVAAWRFRPTAPEGSSFFSRIAEEWGGAALIAIAAAASLFLAAEEVNWGQTFAHWGVPESEKPHPTSLHNNDDSIPISVNLLGALWLLGHFFLLPLVWKVRSRLQFSELFRVRESWGVAVAEAPVTFTLIVSVAWKLIKDFDERPDEPGIDAFWDGFTEQLNEQKEMLVAIALLMYACYRVGAVRRLRRERAQ